MFLDFDKKFKNLDGTEIEGETMARVLSAILGHKPEGLEIAKASIWHIDLYKNGFLDLDKVDVEKFENFLKKNVEMPNGLTVAAWSQIDQIIREAKEKAASN